MRAMRGTPTCAFVVRRSELSGEERPTDGQPRIARTAVAQGEHSFGKGEQAASRATKVFDLSRRSSNCARNKLETASTPTAGSIDLWSRPDREVLCVIVTTRFSFFVFVFVLLFLVESTTAADPMPLNSSSKWYEVGVLKKAVQTNHNLGIV